MRDFKIFAMIADIHIGKKRVSPEALKKQLKEFHIKPLKKMKYVDGIFVLGDVLDCILSLNSEYSEVFHWLIDQWYSIARKRDCPCIIIKGTKSHDNDQLNNVKHYQYNDDGVDFRIYENIEVIELYKKYKILILPDIKVRQNSDIEKYFNQTYDMILGHGTISTMQFFIQESENMPTKTYVYDLKTLMNICRGPIVFGHIHPFTNYKNKFYYAGSFDKLERGSEGDNGFLICGISDHDTSKYRIEQYVNESAASYIDIQLDKDTIKDNSIDDLLEYIAICIAEAKPNDLIHITISRDDDNDSIDKVMMIDNAYRHDKRVGIKKKIKTKSREEEEIKMAGMRDKYAYLVDENLAVSEIVYRYYMDERDSKFRDSPVELTYEMCVDFLGG